MNHPVIYHRNGLGQWLTDHDFQGEGVEIGVQIAENAERIMQTYNGNIYLVDPFVKQSDEVYLDGTNRINFDEAWNEAHVRMARFKERVKWIREYSHDAATKLFHPKDHDSLDFVYIDGNHKYDFVKQDIEDWFPFVKVGGIIGGHDFEDRFVPGVYDCGVRHAVEEWSRNTGIPIFASVSQAAGGCGSWWARKP